MQGVVHNNLIIYLKRVVSNKVMERTFKLTDDRLSPNIFVYKVILGYPCVANMSKESRTRRDIEQYISKCLSTSSVPKLIIKHRGREKQINCMITNTIREEYVIYHYILDIFKKNSTKGLLILSVPTDPESVSPPCLICKGNINGEYKPFDPFSKETTKIYEQLVKDHGW
jgi:hypothetical protein